MNKKEEQSNATPRKDMMRQALAHYEELATKACWHRSDIPEAIRAYYAAAAKSEPAEGAERKCKICGKPVICDILCYEHQMCNVPQPPTAEDAVAKTETDTGHLIDMPDLRPVSEELLREFAEKYCITHVYRGFWKGIQGTGMSEDEFLSDLNALLDKLMPTREDLAAEMIARYISTNQYRNNRVAPMLKKAFADGAEWFRSRMKGESK